MKDHNTGNKTNLLISSRSWITIKNYKEKCHIGKR